jgi:hypothetical protein
MSEPEIIFDYDPRNLPQDILAAIGLVTAASAQTEGVVQQAIAACLKIEADYGLAVTTHMAAPLRDQVLRAVAEIRIDDLDQLDRLDELLDDINAAFGKRNEYVHHAWCRHPDTGQVFTAKITARGSVDAELIPMSVDQIKRDASFVYDAGMALMKFLMRHKLSLTFPPARRERAHKTKAARKKRRKDMLRGK